MHHYLPKASCIIGILTTVSVSCSPVASGASWTRLGRSDFPARVQAVVFTDDLRIDASHSMRWGQWTVRYGSEPVVAKISQDDESFFTVTLFNLSCGNPVHGESNCEGMALSRGRGKDSGKFLCYLWAPATPPISLKCPAELKLF